MSNRVRLTIDEGVASVLLTRPNKLNALDLAMFEALIDVGKEVSADKSVRAVVLHGEGEGFCSGLDSEWLLESGEQLVEHLIRRGSESPANLAQRPAWIWQEVAVPVIAAVHGAALGGGLQIALGADLRYVTPHAKLSVMEIKWGLIPDMALSQTLLGLVPIDVAKELTFSGRIFSGQEAVGLGVATRACDDPLRDALAMAHTIAAMSPHAICAAKHMMNVAPSLTEAESFKLETELQIALLGTPNQLEAQRAVVTGCTPSFQDPE